MRNFGVPGLGKWAELLTDAGDPKGWPRLLAPPGRQFQFLTWLYDWVETAGTGGGCFRAMYAEFLEEAAGPLDRPELGLAGDYRELAAAWTALAGTAVAAGGDGPLARGAVLLATRRRLVEERGADAAAELPPSSRSWTAWPAPPPTPSPSTPPPCPSCSPSCEPRSPTWPRVRRAPPPACGRPPPPGSGTRTPRPATGQPVRRRGGADCPGIPMPKELR